MSRQITIGRAELALPDLILNDPTNGYYVSDEWSQGGIVWQRYEAATSPFSHGNSIVAQRKQNVDEIFTIYINTINQTDYNNKIYDLAEALSQYRYTLSIEWDGYTYSYNAAGAGELQRQNTNVDPVLHRAGWHAFQITIPRLPE